MRPAIYYGAAMALIGVYFFLSALLRSKKIPYRWLYQRSHLLWKSKTHTFYLVVGLILIVIGVLWAAGVVFR